MSEPAYITLTEQERDLILNAFGGVRAERVAEMVEALKEAEACMSLVSPLGYKYEYLRVLSHIRSALAKASPTPPRKVPDPTGSER